MNKVLEMPRSLSRRFRLNVLSYGYTQLVTLAAQLVLVPFFLHAWGTGRYADWLVLTGIPSMLSLLDLGSPRPRPPAPPCAPAKAMCPVQDAVCRPHWRLPWWWSRG